MYYIKDNHILNIKVLIKPKEEGLFMVRSNLCLRLLFAGKLFASVLEFFNLEQLLPSLKDIFHNEFN